MADQRFESGVVRDLVDETAAIGELAKSEEAFRAAIAAFQSADRTAFQAVLEKLQLTVHCRLICEWIRSKQCVLLCLQALRPPKPTDQPPDPRALAEAIARLSADEKAIREAGGDRREGRRRGLPALHRRIQARTVLPPVLSLGLLRAVPARVPVGLQPRPQGAAELRDRAAVGGSCRPRPARTQDSVRRRRRGVHGRRRDQAGGCHRSSGAGAVLPLHLPVLLQLALRTGLPQAVSPVPLRRDTRSAEGDAGTSLRRFSRWLPTARRSRS